MSLESSIKEPILRDNFTDGEAPEFTVQPGMFMPITEKEGVANYTGEQIKVSVKIQGGKMLIGLHT